MPFDASHAARRWPLRGRSLVFLLACVAAATLFRSGTQANAAEPPIAAVAARETGDLHTLGRPYAVVDKHRALISVHHAGGRLAGQSAVILGSAWGDYTLPGVGERTSAGRLRPQDKTTPAGRFIPQRGRNLTGETVLWLDYRAALAIHRLRPGRSAAQRSQALTQGTPSQRRLSDGCVVVPGAFFDRVVLPLLGGGDGLVVVLPEGASAAGLNDAH